MKVNIKNFVVQMDIKNKGIELDVTDSGGHIGDLVITKTKLEWCNGKTQPGKGKSVTWKDFIDYMEKNNLFNLYVVKTLDFGYPQRGEEGKVCSE